MKHDHKTVRTLFRVGCPLTIVLLWGWIFLHPAGAQTSRFYGEPVQLKGNAIYFTSWKYVHPGQFRWDVQFDPDVTDEQKTQLGWLKGDGTRPARFDSSAMPRGIRLVAQPARKVPCSERVAQVFDEGKYKAWYEVGPCPEPEPFSTKDKILPGHNSHIAYAESDDGRTWHEPDLGLFEYAGNKNNSIVYRGDVNGLTRGYHGGCVFVDPSSKEERYKMLHLGLITEEEWNAFVQKYPGEADTMARRPDISGYRCVFAVFGAVSPDGIHWNVLPEPLMIQHADTANTCYYDTDLKQYVAYVRAWQVNERLRRGEPDNDTSWIGTGRRSIGRALSSDFRHFSPPEIVISTGADQPPSHVWYNNCKTTLPGCPDNHVMFPWLWETESDGGDIWLWSSADGWTWSKVPGGPVVRSGLPGENDGGYVFCTGNLLEYPDNTWCLAYSGNPIPHKYPGRNLEFRKGLFPGLTGVGGRATWPKGRLVALQCDEEGEFSTVAVIPPADRIRINAVIKPTGYIKVAVRHLGKSKDIDERSFEQTDTMVGDSLAFPVRWNGQESLSCQGKPIRLRFQMRQAKLYAIEFY